MGNKQEKHWKYRMGGMVAEIIYRPGRGYKSIVNEYWEMEHKTRAEAMAEILGYCEVPEDDF